MDDLSALDSLAAALHDERRALIENDADALLQANAAKLAALAIVEKQTHTIESRERVSELAELNRSNGILLARRQREVRWALRRLGRVEPNNSYGSNGRVQTRTTRRALGVG